jgi:hypothetical protein
VLSDHKGPKEEEVHKELKVLLEDKELKELKE